jgi:hypothetical protein
MYKWDYLMNIRIRSHYFVINELVGVLKDKFDLIGWIFNVYSDGYLIYIFGIII